MLTLDELRAAIVMMKRAPLNGEESFIVAQTITKLQCMAEQQARASAEPEAIEVDD